MRRILNIVLSLTAVVGLVYACSSDYLEPYTETLILNSEDPRTANIVADSVRIASNSGVETLSIGEYEQEKIVDIYTEVGPYGSIATVKVRIRYNAFSGQTTCTSYCVSSYSGVEWEETYCGSVVGCLKVAGYLYFSGEAASIVGRTERWINIEDKYALSW